jgi:hypothetical protein
MELELLSVRLDQIDETGPIGEARVTVSGSMLSFHLLETLSKVHH